MRIKFLGIGGAMNTDSISTSFLIDNKILFETPPAIPSSIYKWNQNIKDIDNIVISHLHGDHYFGLIFLLLEYYLIVRDRKLNIYGDEKLKKNTRQLLELAYPGMDFEDVLEKANAVFHPIKPGDSFCVQKDYEINVVSAKHTDVQTCGFVIHHKSSNVYYSADSSWFCDMANYIQKADMCILDGSLENIELPGHMSFSRISKVASSYPNTRFCVAHRSIYKCSGFDNIIIPNEGVSIEI